MKAREAARDYCIELGLQTDILQQFEIEFGRITDCNLIYCFRWLEQLEMTVWRIAG